MRYSEYYKSKNQSSKSKNSSSKSKNPSSPDTKFIKWIDQVEQIVFTNIGFNLLDLPDQMYMISFEEGITPQEMANQVLSDGF